MKSVRALFVLTLPALLAGAASSQSAAFLGNEVQLSAGGSTVWIYNSPSVGGTTGAPILGADLAYKGVPQNRTRTASGTANLRSLEDIFLGDLDWPNGAPDFYDIAIDTSSAEFGVQFDNLIPDFFASGSVAALLSLGNSGFPNPCTQGAAGCTGSLGCPAPVTGYIVSLELLSPIAIPGGQDDLAGTSLVNFLPGGMVYGASSGVGACGLGDYVFQGAQSLTENQADYLTQAGTSWCEGFQLGDPAGVSPTGPLEDANTTMLEMNFGLDDIVVEAEITDAGAGYGPVRGGASLGVDTQTGTATLAAHVTAGPGLAGSLVFPAVALGQLPVAVPVFGAGLMINPDGTFNSTFAAYSGTGPLLAVDDVGDPTPDQAEAVSVSLPLPVMPGPLRAYMQAFIVTGFGPITAVSSTVWAIDLR
ncbi:MAG: hypothetical protein WD226_10000 [Planctomycetota bacterium]